MQFGDRSDFAVEILVDWPLCTSREARKHIAGRIRVWIDDEPIGDLDDWGCWLENPVEDIVAMAASSERLWLPRLAGVPAREQFDAMTAIWYGHVQGRDIDEDDVEHEVWRAVIDPALVGSEVLDPERLRQELARIQDRKQGMSDPTFLTNTSEAFDGWMAFVLREPDSGRTRFLWQADDGPVRSHGTADETFAEVARASHAWLMEQKTEWTRPPADELP